MRRSTRRTREARLQVASSRITRSHHGRPAVLPDTTIFLSDSGSFDAPLSLGQSSPNTGVGPFSNSRDFVVHNATFNNIHSDQDIITQGMKSLSQRIIDGTEYDSSLRDPPPQCHPGTRAQLHGKISTWLQNKEREKALLWLSGPAGVGKSAVIQTLAESLAESNHLGASLFFSRLNDRKDPQRVFFTVAFQLATRVPAYRTYVTGRIALDPSLLGKGMKEQFRIFISEPFGHQGIGKERGLWAILLDGLDECDGVEGQCKIVQLVSEFVLSFPDAPLVWTISSRPEPHIVAIFANKAVAPSYFSEYIPIDSTEACQDVERYLNTSFEAIREQYPYVPPGWPSETQFLKLANGALGLFIFARTAVRFMKDPHHANPASRLNLILSVIEHMDVKVTDDHPFALLDALYFQILTSIPQTLRHTTKRILGFSLCTRSKPSDNGLAYPLQSRSLTGASIILGLEQGVVYGSLHKLHSVLQIPQWKHAHEFGISILHASFGDYLVDRTRSQEFWVDWDGCVDEITHRLYQLYLAKPWGNDWVAYTPWLSKACGELFYQELKRDIEASPYYAVTGSLRLSRGGGPIVSQEDRTGCLDALSKVNTAEIYKLSEYRYAYADFLFQLWKRFPGELAGRGLCKELRLQDLKIDHLDCGKNKPIRGSSKPKSPDSPHALQDFIAELKSLQQKFPGELVLVYGNTPEKRSAFVHIELDGLSYYQCCCPYPY